MADTPSTAPKPEPQAERRENGQSPAAGSARVPLRKTAGHPPEDPFAAPPPPRPQWTAPASPPPAKWRKDIEPDPPAPVRSATLWAALLTAVLSSLLLGDGIGVNLLLLALPAAFAAAAAARFAGRRPRPWTLGWAAGGLALLAIPALRAAGWLSFLAVVAALALGSLALHGSRTWPGVLLAPAGIFGAVPRGARWAWEGLRERASESRAWWPLVRAGGVAAALLLVFGALFSGADAAFADLLGRVAPDISVADGPGRLFYFLVGLAGTLAAALTAAAPLRWDRVKPVPGRPRGRLEWALPLVLLDALFAAFVAVQLTVLFGGYHRVLRETGLTYAEYARQGFWQLLWVTVLTLAVIALALRWAPRGGHRDRVLVRAVLGSLCVLTLVVVASALRRMVLYIDAYGLTRLRISVAGVELWLGAVVVLLMAAGILGGRWLPRAVVASGAAAVLAFGLLSPDSLVAQQNIRRYERTGKIDLGYLQGLSADAVPELDRLPEPLRSCALERIGQELPASAKPWYATSLAEVRARRILQERPLQSGYPCGISGTEEFGTQP